MPSLCKQKSVNEASSSNETMYHQLTGEWAEPSYNRLPTLLQAEPNWLQQWSLAHPKTPIQALKHGTQPTKPTCLLHTFWPLILLSRYQACLRARFCVILSNAGSAWQSLEWRVLLRP